MKIGVNDGGVVEVWGELPEGDAGIRATLAAMKARVEEAAQDPVIRAAAVDMHGIGGINGVYEFLRNGRTFAEDPDGIELLRNPVEVFTAIKNGEMPGVDCDDVAMLGASILQAIGHRAVLIVVGKQPKLAGGRFHHVFFGVVIGYGDKPTTKNVFPLDPQEGYFGEWPPVMQRVGMVEV